MCKVKMPSKFERELYTKFKGFICGHAVEKGQKKWAVGMGEGPSVFFPVQTSLQNKWSMMGQKKLFCECICNCHMEFSIKLQK